MNWLAVSLGELGVRRPLVVLALLAGLVLFSVPGLTQLRVATQLSALVPVESEAAAALAMVADGLEDSEAVYGLLEVAPGYTAADGELAEVAEKLSMSFSASSFVEASRWSPGKGLPTTDPRALFGVMDQTALDAVVERFEPSRMEEQARALRRMLGGPIDGEMRAWLRSDPLLLGEILGEQMTRGLNRVGGPGDGFVSPDGRALLVVIEPAERAGDPFHEELAVELNSIAEKVMQELAPQGRLLFGMTGARIQAWQIAQASRSEASLLSLASLVFVLLLYLGFYRSFISLLLVLGLLPVSVLVTLGWAGSYLGDINPLAVGFVAIVFGLGIDPAIHLISRYRALLSSLDSIEAARTAVRQVGPAVVLATTTTSAALLLLATLDPVQGQVGLLAGLAVASNGLVMLIGLPALWRVLGSRITPDPGLGVAASRSLAGWLRDHGKAVLVIALVACGVLAALASTPEYRASLRGFQPESLSSVQVQRSLEQHYGESAGELFVLCRGADQQSVLEANDRWADRLAELRMKGSIVGFDSVAVLYPAEVTMKARYDDLLSRVDLSASLAAFREALGTVGFAPGAFDAALRDLERPPSRVSLAVEWSEWLKQRYMHTVGGEFQVLTRVFPKGDLLSAQQLLRAEAPRTVEGVSAQITGVELVEHDATQLLAYRLPKLLLLLSLGLLVLLVLVYRRPALVVAAYLPLQLSLVLFMLAHLALGASITPFTLAGLLLLVGVGIDDHLFMLAHYLGEGSEGSLEDTLAGAGRAILVTTCTSLAAFGVLSFSQFGPLASFGRAAGLALALAFLSSVVLLPALLGWRERRGARSPR